MTTGGALLAIEPALSCFCVMQGCFIEQRNENAGVEEVRSSVLTIYTTVYRQ